MDLEGHVLAGRYQVLRQLQSGYFGTTWLAKDTQDVESRVCVKTFFTESSAQQRELMVLQQLCNRHFHHDNLCSVFQVSLERAPVLGPSGDLVTRLQYVVFEYCSGSDLFNFLCSGPYERMGACSSFPEALARHYFTQCVLGLMYLHERGVYHRDIKPENCVLDSNWDLKLTDFGTNKIITAEDQPVHVLRANTRGIGTESYRAPEVNSGKSYDPAAADVWSMGVMLFFFVGVSVMADKVKSLDQYTRNFIAPLGLFFPFPHHCSKLDSYLRRAPELRGCGITGGLRAAALPNKKFWSEWKSLVDQLSPNLIDLFNRIFLLEPSLRISLRDIVRHLWMNRGDKLEPEEIRVAMEERCPSSITMKREASPRVSSGRLLGGVDQAVLRESLSNTGKQSEVFLEDSELWVWSEDILHLESVQAMVVGLDIQDLMVDLNYAKQVLKSILSKPASEEHRCVSGSTNWIVELLLVLGFLPHEYSYYLCEDRLNLLLVNQAVTMLEGLELAITQSVISTTHDENGDTEEEMVYMEGLDFDVTANGRNEEDNSNMEEDYKGVVREDFMGTSPLAAESQETPVVSSQGSVGWTQYTMSSQSSQEELPESLQQSHDWAESFSTVHKLLNLNRSVNVQSSEQYKGATEFCKLSGLICSYGLYQVVCQDQLVLYCRGNTTCFSLRVVHVLTECLTSSALCLSSWCLGNGVEEWNTILERLHRDMEGSAVECPSHGSSSCQ